MSDIIRAYELNRYDLFIKQAVLFIVVKLTDIHILYSVYDREAGTYCGIYREMGRRSQERVEYFGTKPIKKKTKPIKEDYFI